MNTVDAVDVLERAKEILADSEKWIKGDYARDAGGVGVDSESEAACRFCALGALAKAGVDAPATREVARLRLISCLPPGFAGNVAHFNDDPETQHADVLALFDRAVAAEKERSGT